MTRSETESAEADTSALPEYGSTRTPPSTARGARTRAALVAAARVVFERDGYQASKLTDITREAKCAIGTFYTYFDSKDEALMAVLLDAEDEMAHPDMTDAPRSDRDPIAALEASNRAYFESYQRNARLMLLQEEVATVDPVFRAYRKRRGDVFVDRNARGIMRLQAAGLANADLDPRLTSRALSAMVSRLAYGSFALGDDEHSLDELVSTSTRVWASALGLKERA